MSPRDWWEDQLGVGDDAHDQPSDAQHRAGDREQVRDVMRLAGPVPVAGASGAARHPGGCP